MNQALRQLLIVGLAPFCMLALVVRAQEATPPVSESPTPAKQETTDVQPKDDPAKTNDTPPAAAEVPAPAKDETAAAAKESPPVKDEASAANSAPAAAPVAAEAAPAPQAAPATPEPVKPAQETVTQVPPAAPAPAPEATAAAPIPAAPEPEKPAEATIVTAAPAPAPAAAPVAAEAAPAPQAAPATPADMPAPALATETTAVAAPAPAAPEPTKPAASTEATAVAAATAPAPDVAPVASTVTPSAALPVPVAEAAPEPVKPAQETVAQIPPATPAPAPELPAPTPAPAATEAAVDTAAPVAAANSGVAVDHFEFSYGLAHPALPPLTQLQSLTIKTTRDGNVFRGPSAGKEESLSLGAIPAGSRFDADALRSVAQEVVRWYNSRGLYGVWVAFNSELEASNTGIVDTRQPDDRAARLVIWASQVSEVRTLARGKRIKPQFSINNRKHRRILKGSPLHPGLTPDQPGSLFNQEVLNNYLYGLSLHPGRRVEASIASAGQPGKVVLDYLVNESKAWQLFSQVNNYGTKATGEIRGRLGYQDNQLTNHDDILNIDLISTPDYKTYGTFLSYRIPVWRPAKVLMRIYGSYGDFLTQANNTDLVHILYAGKNWTGGLELTNRLSLWRGWQLQSGLGANYNHYGIQQLINSGNTTNQLSAGTVNFLVPFIETNLSRDYSWGSLSGGLRIDHTVSSPKVDPVTHSTGIDNLGRRGADPQWTSARWDLNTTVYLDQLFKRTDQPGALTHELSVRVKGRQLLRGKRLIPHEQEPLGGGLSVRGYPESIISADEFYAVTIEYAYHIPRGLKPAEEGKLFGRPFKWRPKQVGQSPDWDLSLRAFYDYAYRGVSPAPLSKGQDPVKEADLPFVDKNLTIAGTGVGVALQVKQNFSLRCDFGKALTELRDPNLDALHPENQIVTAQGNTQLYFISTFTW